MEIVRKTRKGKSYESAKRYNEINREEINKRRRYNYANCSRRRIENQNRVNLVKNGGTFTVEDWELLKVKYNHTCLMCNRSEPEIKLTIDHVIPVSLGGRNVIENIQPLCKPCNSKKNAKVIDFRR